MSDPYYRSKEWKQLRAAALKRDGGRCTMPGCPAGATHVDHIISRRHGGADTLTNLDPTPGHAVRTTARVSRPVRRHRGRAELTLRVLLADAKYHSYPHALHATVTDLGSSGRPAVVITTLNPHP